MKTPKVEHTLPESYRPIPAQVPQASHSPLPERNSQTPAPALVPAWQLGEADEMAKRYKQERDEIQNKLTEATEAFNALHRDWNKINSERDQAYSKGWTEGSEYQLAIHKTPAQLAEFKESQSISGPDSVYVAAYLHEELLAHAQRLADACGQALVAMSGTDWPIKNKLREALAQYNESPADADALEALDQLEQLDGGE